MSISPRPLPARQPGLTDQPPQRPTLGSGATMVAGAQITMAGLGALVSIIVARLLGPTDMGAFSVIGSAFLLAGALSTLGLHTGFTYYVSRRMQSAGDAIRQAQMAALPLGVFAGAAVVGLAAATSDGVFREIPLGTLAVAMAFLPFSFYMTSLGQVALACDRHKAYSVATVGNMSLYLAFAIVLTPVLGLVGAVLASTVPYAIAALGLGLWLGRSVAGPSREWVRHAWGQIRRAVRFGAKSYASYALGLLNQRVDVFILNAVAIQATVGHYAIAVAVTSVGLVLPKALSMAVLPRVAALEDGPVWEQAMVVRKSARHALLIGVATAGALALGALLIPLVYGSAFSPAVVPALILALGVAALGVAQVLSGISTAKGRPEYSLYTALLVTPPSIAGYLILIPALEATGAALASTASYLATLFVAAIFFRRATSVSRWREMLPSHEEIDDYATLARRLWNAGRLRLRAASGGRSG